jgi:hypothetical protein
MYLVMDFPLQSEGEGPRGTEAQRPTLRIVRKLFDLMKFDNRIR